MPRNPQYMTKDQKKAALAPLLLAQKEAHKARKAADAGVKAVQKTLSVAIKNATKADAALEIAKAKTAKVDAIPVIVAPKAPPKKSVVEAPKVRKPRTPKATTAPASTTVN